MLERDSDFDRDSLSEEQPIGRITTLRKSIKPGKQMKWFMFGRTSEKKRVNIVNNEKQTEHELEYLVK